MHGGTTRGGNPKEVHHSSSPHTTNPQGKNLFFVLQQLLRSPGLCSKCCNSICKVTCESSGRYHTPCPTNKPPVTQQPWSFSAVKRTLMYKCLGLFMRLILGGAVNSPLTAHPGAHSAGLMCCCGQSTQRGGKMFAGQWRESLF